VNVFWTRKFSHPGSLHVLNDRMDRKTVCGWTSKSAMEVFDNRPAGRTCENCLRWLAKQVD
jgi:hypothetical protein